MASSFEKHPFSTRVGVLGGGQLARMLVLKGHEMGLTMKVLCKSKHDPAAQVTAHATIGDPDDEKDVAAFAAECDVVTLESEFHSGEMLARASAASGTPFRPDPGIIRRLQDRLPQKEALVEHGVPTAPFLSIVNHEDLQIAIDEFQDGFVLKKRTGGYDGYGTVIVRKDADLEAARGADLARARWIAEAFVPFKRELAVQIARGTDGRTVVFPLVETKQVDHRLDWLRGPVKHPNFAALSKRLVRFVREIDYVGVIAFELFDTGKNLLVNEIAPRVHNSGHASLEALTVDQFTQHLRAILGHALETPKPLTKGFAMTNLIGAGAEKPAAPAKIAGHLHWYGKSESRRGRKMGHLTLTGVSADACLRQVLKERKGFSL